MVVSVSKESSDDAVSVAVMMVVTVCVRGRSCHDHSRGSGLHIDGLLRRRVVGLARLRLI